MLRGAHKGANLRTERPTFLANQGLKARAYTVVAISLFFLGYCWTYVLAQYLHKPVDDLLLYHAEDPGYVAGAFSDNPLIGVHRFGDFLTTSSWAILPNPYAEGLPFPSIYGPTALWFHRLFLWLPMKWALLSFLLVSALALVIVLFALLRKVDFLSRCLIILAGLLLTRPFLLMLDRGNVQGVVVALEALAILFVLVNRPWLAAGVIVLAATMKFYPIVLVVLLFVRKQFRQAFVALGATAALVALGLATMSGQGFMNGVNGLFKGLAINGDLFLSGASATAWLARLGVVTGAVLPVDFSVTNLKVLNAVVAVVLVSLTAFAMRKNYLSITRLAILLLSMTTLFVPVSWAYNLLWATVAVVLLVARDDWRTGNRLFDGFTLFGFAPVLALLPFAIQMDRVQNTGIAELWTFPFMLTLFVAWAFVKPQALSQSTS